MSDSPTSPLIEAEASTSERPPSKKSNSSIRSKRSQQSSRSSESTPLLSREDGYGTYGDGSTNGVAASPAATSLRSLQGGPHAKGRTGSRWPTIVALTVLSLVAATILSLGFAAPAIVEKYAKEALVFEPTKLSIDSFTATGVKARIQGTFTLDGSRVHQKAVRDLGRFGTWIARAVESKESQVVVYLPEYDDILLGTAVVPPIVVDVRDGHTTPIDFITDLEPGDVDGIRQIANDWLNGRLGRLRVQGKADVSLRSGLFNLGTQMISESLVFEGHMPHHPFAFGLRRGKNVNIFDTGQDLPSIPKYDIEKLNFHEVHLPGDLPLIAVDVSLALSNEYPVKFTIPPLGFDILVPNCGPNEPYILVAKATTDEVEVQPKKKVLVNVDGLVRQLPDTLTTTCPNSDSSPLDLLLGDYIHGMETTIYVRGSDTPSSETPPWITDLIKSVVVPVPFPGHSFDNLIKKFTLADVRFGLPDPLAEPDTPDAQPRLSATVKALVGLPKEMNFPIDVARVRANADVFYRGKQLGHLDLHRWQQANSTRLETHEEEPAALAVESHVKDAPLQITDNDVFTDLIQALVFGGKGVVLGIKADVDVETETALGKFVVRKVPAEGKVFVKPISGGNLEGFSPKIGALQIVETTKSTLLLQAKVNITNPTAYSATIPYMNINLLSNGTMLGQATVRNLSIVPGSNDNLEAEALWDPVTSSGRAGLEQGREFLSQYISGYNTTLTFKTHNGTIPSQPALGKALSHFEIDIPTPQLRPPKNPNHHDGDDDDDRDDNAPHFIEDATMHLLTSSATFTLLSPLPHSTIYITYINATAFYNHTAPVGNIIYDLPIAVPPGASETPRLPVDWSLDSVGYEAVKQALGGTLKLDAKATLSVRIGRWQEKVWFVGGGIGAKITI